MADGDPLLNQDLKRATKFLEVSSRIRLMRYNKHRCVNLNIQQIFDSLSNLYASIFRIHWRHFYRLMEVFPSPDTETSLELHAARCYISFWFIDLYVSNRNAVRNLPGFHESYQGNLASILVEYDSYLTLLNASIRPTLIKYASDDALYIPIIADVPYEVVDCTNNPFEIVHFNADIVLFHGLHNVIARKKAMKLSPLKTNTTGSPCWLLDWHSANKVCAWFHAHENFTVEDITLAYILGVPCTPNLGPRDVDDWQFFPKGVTPENLDVRELNRHHPRRFAGTYEVRTVEIDREYSPTTQAAAAAQQEVTKPPAAKKAKGEEVSKSLTNEGADADEEDGEIMRAPRFRLIDWVYYYYPVLKMEDDTRIDALWKIICSHDN